MYDRQSGVTILVSVDSSGAQANADSMSPAISGDGRYVAFISDATNLVSGDTDGVADIFVHDRQTGATERISIATDGTQANAGSSDVSISADGRVVVFTSSATNLVSGDTNGKTDIFARDRQTGITTRMSVNSSGEQADGGGDHPLSQGMAATLYSYLIQVILIPEPTNIEAKTLSTCTTARSDRPCSPRSLQMGVS